MKTFVRFAMVLLLLCLSGCFRTDSNGTENRQVETVTKTTEIREVLHEGVTVSLKTTTYTQTVSKEQANWESQQNSTVQPPQLGGLLGSLASGGILGGGPLLDVGTIIGTIFGGKKVYDKVRDAPPRSPQPRQHQVDNTVRRPEEEIQ